MTSSGKPRRLALLGNEAIGRGIVESGCHLAMAYPGTPSSEVLPSVIRFARDEGVALHTEWCANEKVALEQALAAAYTGKRTAVIMKQVGLNVAADPLLSAAYIGVVGGTVLVVADDPGPTSSQTEQDTRQFAHFAKVPVLDPASPDEARRMASYAFDLSERHGIPVILRPALRVCHARQDVALDEVQTLSRPARFERDPDRWAATPRHRYRLHAELNQRLRAIAAEFEAEERFNYVLHGDAASELAVVASGNPFAVLLDLLAAFGLETRIPVLKIGTPYPFPARLVDDFVARYPKVLVLEETDQLIELLLGHRDRVMGRHDGTVPDEGELDAAVIGRILGERLAALGMIAEPWDLGSEGAAVSAGLEIPPRPPVLCAGCPHRASFLAIRQAGGKNGIYPSDIGCYTLGTSQGGVDTCHDMGAAVSMAAGFYHAFAADLKAGHAERLPPIVATIGDSTFYHGGLSPLANAVYADARFTLVILDNMVTAMTGMQPTLMSGVQADGSMGRPLSLEETCRGLGVKWLEVVDPFQVPEMVALLKSAIAFNRDPTGGLAVLIARRPCAIHEPRSFEPRKVEISDRCNLCRVCLDYFGCPALQLGAEKVTIDETLCVDCGICIHSCARQGILPVSPSPDGDGAASDGGETAGPPR